MWSRLMALGWGHTHELSGGSKLTVWILKSEIFPGCKGREKVTGRAMKWRKSEVKSLSHVQLFATPWTVAYQAPLSMGFSRQECWSRLPFPSPGDLPDPGIEPRSPTLLADALQSEPPGKPMRYESCLQRIHLLLLVWKCQKAAKSQGTRLDMIKNQILPTPPATIYHFFHSLLNHDFHEHTEMLVFLPSYFF